MTSSSEISDLVSSLDNVIELLDSIDLDNPESLLYGFRDRYEQLKERAKAVVKSLRSELSDFFRKLTDTSSATLPEWVYNASVGALRSVLDLLEDQYSSENEHGRRVALGMIREAVNALRVRIREAEKAAIEKRKNDEKEAEEKEKEKEKDNTASVSESDKNPEISVQEAQIKEPETKVE